ncbi:hypothetical protein FACS1894216_16370 [Synergistales bacterium]|nr:hypothetical protein FACS1894216_16370 [Synergistales bacterium]
MDQLKEFELIPQMCPLCKCEPELDFHISGVGYCPDDGYSYVCPICRYRTVRYVSKEAALMYWNEINLRSVALWLRHKELMRERCQTEQVGKQQEARHDELSGSVISFCKRVLDGDGTDGEIEILPQILGRAFALLAPPSGFAD